MHFSKLMLVVAALLPSGLFAQLSTPEVTQSNKWKLSYVGSSLGVQGDHYFNMDMDFMESRINDANYKGVDFSDMDLENYTYSDVGLNINLQLRFRKGASSAADVSGYTELETSLGAVMGREIMIDYHGDEILPVETEGMDMGMTALTFCDLQNEISLGAAYKKGVSIFNVLSLYTGVGAQLASTVGSQFWIFGNGIRNANGEEYVDEVYNVKESMMGRVYIPLGGELVVMDKLHLNGEVRLGYGRHQTFKGTGYGNMNYAVLLGLGWSI